MTNKEQLIRIMDENYLTNKQAAWLSGVSFSCIRAWKSSGRNMEQPKGAKALATLIYNLKSLHFLRGA